MEENEVVNNEPVVTSGSKVKDLLSKRYPDRSFEPADGSDGSDELNQAILDAITESDERAAYLEGKLNALAELFSTSPRASTFLNTLAATKNPAEAIYRAYGRDAYEEFTAGNVSDFITRIEEEDKARNEADEKAASERAANLDASIESLSKFGEARGMSIEEQRDLFFSVYDLNVKMNEGIYPVEVFEAALKARNYDTDIANARKEGEISGRNAKIDDMKMRRSRVENMTPSLMGQGARMPESKPDTRPNPWMLDD